MSVQLSDDHHRNPITLTRFLLAERKQFRDASGDFNMLLMSIQLAIKVIANAAKKAGMANIYGLAGGQNMSGDEQKKLDVFSDEVFVNCLTFSDQVYIMGSEERDAPIIVGEKRGGYAVVFDPLDGSSNIDANVSVGTIFGVYRKDPLSLEKPSERDLLKPGTELVAAGYALYGSATMIVLTTGQGTNGFTLDPSLGEFILTHKDIKIPRRGNIYSINEANDDLWDRATAECVKVWKSEAGKKRYTARYVGSMVADVHRTLLYGGIFCYPADRKNTSGKLRLLYECNPMAFVVEQAGGRATTGTQRVLEVSPKKLHGKSPLFIGSVDDVRLVEEMFAKFPPQQKSSL